MLAISLLTYATQLRKIQLIQLLRMFYHSPHKKMLLLFALGFLVLGVFGFWLTHQRASAVTNSDNNAMQVSASFYPMAFLAQAIGGERVQVATITPPGAEPHDYEPSAQDMLTIQQSQLLFVNGQLEPWLDQVTANSQPNGPKIVRVGQGLFSLSGTGQDAHQLDPHLWLDPVKMQQMAAQVTAAYIQVDPSNQAEYQAREQELTTKLQQLDLAYKAGLAHCQQHSIYYYARSLWLFGSGIWFEARCHHRVVS